MAVNGGSGSEIKFSEIQAHYGGTRPIRLSDYYRGGDLVPQNSVEVLSYTSGNSSQNVGEFTVSVTGGYTGALENRTTVRDSSTAASGTVTLTYTVQPSDAVLILSGGGFDNIGQGETQLSSGWYASGVISLGAQAQGKFFRGPAYQSGDYSNLTFSGTASAGNLTLTTYAGSAGGSVQVATARRAPDHDVTFTNNSSVTITTGPSSTGGAQSYAPNQARTVKSNASTPNWTLGYPAVPGNTNISASGQITLNQFNTLESPAP